MIALGFLTVRASKSGNTFNIVVALIPSWLNLVIYQMILLIFSIDIEIIVKLLFLEIYFISSFFTDKLKYINKTIFYGVFFTILISLIIYGLYKNLKFIDIILLSASVSSVISALYIGIVSFRNNKK